ncbi:MAG: NCS2 family permease [bacterium]|nr:NCS2 family permease [bacterium]
MEKFFKLRENNTTVRTEVIAGITTFLTMSYIIFVQPAILSVPMNAQGPPADYFGAVLMATCIASALSCFLMALLANYPVGLAPGMGENFYFAFTVCGAAAIGGLGYSWQVALTAVFIAGFAFMVLNFFKFRETVMDSIPNGMKLAIAGGIGFLIAFVGLEYAGIIEHGTGTLIKLGKLNNPWVVLSIIGLIIIGTLMAKRIRGAMLWGIVATAVIGLFMHGSVTQTEGGSDMLVRYQDLVSMPPSLAPTLFKFDFATFIHDPKVWEVVFIFFILEMFDTVGTLIGIGHAAGLLTKEGKLPRAGQAFIADAAATCVGAAAGTSSVQSFIESSTGVAEGGRTGLVAMVVGVLFLLAVFFSPLVKMIGGGYMIGLDSFGSPIIKYPVIAAPLIIVGSLMMKGLKDVDWDDPATSIAAFITIIMMPLTLSIALGIAFGFITYVAIKLLSGKAHEVHWLMYIISAIFILRFAFFPV